MKKFVCFVLIITVVLTLCACAGGGAKPAEDEPAIRTGSFTADDLSIRIGSFTATAKTTMDDVRAALGEEDEYAEAISCVYEGMDKVFTYGEVTVYTYPDGKNDCLMEIYCAGGDVSTAKGITFSATVKEIEAAYGTGYQRSGKLLIYELPVSGANIEPASLYFELENDCVSAIGMTAEHRSE